MLSVGIEFSTQSVKIVVLDISSSTVLYTGSFDYDSAFPGYQTQGGILMHEDPEIRHTSPLMLVEALDFAFATLLADHIDLSLIGALKIDSMQHCTVCTDQSFEKALGTLQPDTELVSQVGSCISRKTSPIWEDRSPKEAAHILTELLKPKGGIDCITGNRTELRFPAAQVMKWAKDFPEEYNHTTSIFLLSAFMTSILTGKVAAVDTGDGWGTNLNTLDIDQPGWSSDVLATVDSYVDASAETNSLRSKLGTMDHYDAPAGKINRYFVQKYHVNPRAIVLTGTGDNPATLLGCGGKIVISLGSSYTVNGIMDTIHPSSTGEYNIFGYTKGRAMALSVFTNGGKVHDYFLNKYIQKADWNAYAKTCGNPVLTNDEPLLLPYLLDESVPLAPKGIIRDGFSVNDTETNIRALHVAQSLSLKLHSPHLDKTDEICVVGGGAGNRFFRQLIADVFDAETYSIHNAGFAAPLGCAMSGARVLLNASYDDITKSYVQKDQTSTCFPQRNNTKVIPILMDRYSSLEKLR